MISFLQAAVPLLLLANASTMHLGHSLTLDQLDVSLVMALINISVPLGHIVICFQGHRQSKDDHFQAEISHGSVRPRNLEPFDHLLREVHTTGVFSTTLLVGSTGSIPHINREIITAHSSSLISVLAQPGFLPRITSFDELIAADIRFGFIDYITHFFEDRDDWRYIKVVREHQSCNKINLCLDRMAYYGDFAVAAPKIFMLNRVSKYISQDGRPMFVPLENYVVRGGIVMYLTKGSFLLNRFNDIITGVVEFGFMNKWMKDLKKADVKLEDINKVYEQRPYVLTLLHLQGPFVWLGTGLAFALMAFTGEMLCKRFRKCYQFKRQ